MWVQVEDLNIKCYGKRKICVWINSQPKMRVLCGGRSQHCELDVLMTSLSSLKRNLWVNMWKEEEKKTTHERLWNRQDHSNDILQIVRAMKIDIAYSQKPTSDTIFVADGKLRKWFNLNKRQICCMMKMAMCVCVLPSAMKTITLIIKQVYLTWCANAL